MSWHLHPNQRSETNGMAIAAAETLLAEFFGIHCVLTASGRSAIHLIWSEAGLSRYRDRIALPKFISRCVQDIAVRHGFPCQADDGVKAAATLRYHQYGFPQVGAGPADSTLEDLCHAFFWPGNHKGAGWVGNAAVFSLPKFFATSGMVGGLLLKDEALAKALRKRRDAASVRDAEDSRRQRKIFAEAYDGDPGFTVALEHLYLDRTMHMAAQPDDLAGLPQSVPGLKAVAHQREDILGQWISAADSMIPQDWRAALVDWKPFGLPLFVEDAAARSQLHQQLRALGFVVDAFNVDIARNQAQPDYRVALMLPCHQQITASDIARVTNLLHLHRI